jgi:hypothetical protein
MATFQDRWPQMKRVVLKILRQEPTSQIEWQNLFTYEPFQCIARFDS